MPRTVKQVAARVGLPERTVRYYDRIGLVSPRVRSSAGYRLYEPTDEGKLRFVRQAKSLGLSLDDIRALITAAEQGCCGQVVPELDRLLDEKIAEIDAQLIELATFRARLVTFRAGRRADCGCRGHGAFCGCLDGAAQAHPSPMSDEGTPVMSEDTESSTVDGCGCGCSSRCGCGCGCDGSCGCGATAGVPAVDRRVAELDLAESRGDEPVELRR